LLSVAGVSVLGEFVDAPEDAESIDMEADVSASVFISEGTVLSDGLSIGALPAESIDPPVSLVALSPQAASPIAVARMKKYFFIKIRFRLKIIAFRPLHLKYYSNFRFSAHIGLNPLKRNKIFFQKKDEGHLNNLWSAFYRPPFSAQ
jgi:hypothetical protein